MDDSHFYLEATKELEEGRENQALWAKAMALMSGDAEKAKYKYIRSRAEILKKELDREYSLADSVEREPDPCTDDSNSGTDPTESRADHKKEPGFIWWIVWGWLGLTLGNLQIALLTSHFIPLTAFLIILNSFLMLMILQNRKAAFLVATILSLNPILWIVNGIYLRNRWNHPRINGVNTPANDKWTLEKRMEEARSRME